MKRFFLLFILVLFVSVMCASCRNMGKYADDGIKYVDDFLNGKKTVRIKSVLKDCPYCDGGYYWSNGYQCECSHCGGDGWVVERL